MAVNLLDHRIGAATCALALVVATTACGGSSTKDEGTATQWPEADVLFHRDPRWLGADAAYSVPLDDGRILWLFGDTFVAKTAANKRSESKMVRNSIAIQTGTDPTTSAMAFHWRGPMEAPTSLFPEDGERWFWPAHGMRLGASLVIFLARFHATPGQGFGFESEGWAVASIADASGDPSEWQIEMRTTTTAPAGINAGVALVRDPDKTDRIVALAVREPGDHAGYLVRYSEANLKAGALDLAEWWTDDDWNAQLVLAGKLEPIFADAAPESSLHWEPTRQQWMHVRSDGFGATTIVASYADRLTGPWSAPRTWFRPPESSRAGLLVYAAKAHPEQSAGGALAVTYASNTFGDLATVIADSTIYYPRFVKIPR